LNDNKQRLEAGKGSELDVLEAQAGVALRRSKLSEARQRLYESSTRALTLCSETVLSSNRVLRAVDEPRVRDARHSFYDAWRAAFDLNPEYHVQRFRVMQEANRLGYARNQRLPELNLKGSYGFNGLGDTPDASWNDIETGGFPSWTVGVELRVPLAGGIKSGNELAAARLRYQSSQHTLHEVETQMVNSLDTALHKIRSARESVQGYRTVQQFNQSVFDSSLARLEVGKVDSRRVLENEADLFEARNSVVEALVQFERAELELELMQGAVLRNRKLDLTQSELGVRTSQLLRRTSLGEVRVQEVVRGIQQDYGRRPIPSTLVETPEQIKARQALNEKLAQMSAGGEPSPASKPAAPPPAGR
jgi:outer membrane protein